MLQTFDAAATAARLPYAALADAIAQANAHNGPFLIDFRVKEEVNVYPMVAPGAAVGELIRRPKIVQGPSGVTPAW